MRKILMALVLCVAASGARATSCIEPAEYRTMTEKQRMQARMSLFPLVFSGVPLETRWEGLDGFTRFRVLRVFKGEADSIVVVGFSNRFGAGIRFDPDKAYVVFASAAPGGYELSPCVSPIAVPARGRPNYPAGLGAGRPPG